ncbi:DMT family transporter [Shewanella kaireitica]|uniref:DMT family transporter n=1 Tax=Shewanella kaireitica TaxID=212021 RepID=UPI00200E0CF1|nr:EamA family transporter [Shewanella kaireitica]MCL1092748.1 DMT family transporter [Shewanella kaireitica]
MTKLALRGELLLLLATLLAAFGWVASKQIISEVPGSVFISARFLLASLILLPFCFNHLVKLTAKQLISISAVGMILAACTQIWVYAISISSTLSEGAFIMSLAMIIAPFTSWLLFRVRPNRAFWLALPIAVIGMMLLTLTNGWQVEQSQWYFLLASALLSLHFVLNKRLTASIKPLTSISLQLFVVGLGGVLSLALSQPEAFEVSSQTLMWFIASTVIATSLRYLMQTTGQFSVKIETASLIMILEPIWTLILSIGLLGEVLEPQKLLGGGVILLSLFVYIRGSNS